MKHVIFPTAASRARLSTPPNNPRLRRLAALDSRPPLIISLSSTLFQQHSKASTYSCRCRTTLRLSGTMWEVTLLLMPVQEHRPRGSYNSQGHGEQRGQQLTRVAAGVPHLSSRTVCAVRLPPVQDERHECRCLSARSRSSHRHLFFLLSRTLRAVSARTQ